MRTPAIPKTAEPWSLTSLREKLIKIGAKVVSHGRYVIFQMAEVAVPQQMFPGHPVADRPAAGTARPCMRGAAHQTRPTVGEVCRDADKPAYFGASARLTGCLRGAPATRDLLLAKPSERAILVSNRRESEECPLKHVYAVHFCRFARRTASDYLIASRAA